MTLREKLAEIRARADAATDENNNTLLRGSWLAEYVPRLIRAVEYLLGCLTWIGAQRDRDEARSVVERILNGEDE